jgi:hypothetical protein
MTTKWAPAILRTYDIAAIRTGPRPVYANRIRNNDNNNINEKDDSSDRGTLEIVWQQLINFEPVTVGRMIIEITNTSMKASRIIEVGNINSNTPLAGEDILVRRLAEAASQAIEKGLATKVCPFFWNLLSLQVNHSLMDESFVIYFRLCTIAQTCHCDIGTSQGCYRSPSGGTTT